MGVMQDLQLCDVYLILNGTRYSSGSTVPYADTYTVRCEFRSYWDPQYHEYYSININGWIAKDGSVLTDDEYFVREYDNGSTSYYPGQYVAWEKTISMAPYKWTGNEIHFQQRANNPEFYYNPDVWGFTFYIAAPAVTAPSWGSGAYFRIANSTATGNVACTWAGAQAGTNNPIASFEYRYSDDNGSTWSSAVTINSTAASGSASLPTSGTVNTTRIYQLRIKGSASSNQYSGWLSGNQGCKRIITLTAPVLSLTSPSNQLVWKVATGSTITGSSSGTVTYELLKSGSATSSSTTTVNANVTLAESAISTWGTSPLSMTIRASCTINGYTATAVSASVGFTYRPTFTDASNLAGSAADGQSLTLTWTAGSLYNGDTVNHLLEYSADGTTFTQLSASAASPYAVSEAVILALTTTPNTEITFRLTASGDGQTGTPLTLSFTYYPTVNPITNLRINGMASASGESFTVTWDASTASNGDPANRYQIVIDGQVYGLVNTTSFEITAAMAYQLGSGTVTVMAQLVSGQNTYSATDGGLSVSFTYRLNFKPISVYDGTAMIACVAEYYDGTSWVSLDWSIWDGEEWE